MRLVKGIGLSHGIEAHDTESGIGHRACVTLGEHQPVTVGIPGILGVKVHDLAIEHGHQIGQIHRAAHMTEAPGVDDLQRLQADLRRQFFNSFRIHSFAFLKIASTISI